MDKASQPSKDEMNERLFYLPKPYEKDATPAATCRKATKVSDEVTAIGLPVYSMVVLKFCASKNCWNIDRYYAQLAREMFEDGLRLKLPTWIRSGKC